MVPSDAEMSRGQHYCWVGTLQGTINANKTALIDTVEIVCGVNITRKIVDIGGKMTSYY